MTLRCLYSSHSAGVQPIHSTQSFSKLNFTQPSDSLEFTTHTQSEKYCHSETRIYITKRIGQFEFIILVVRKSTHYSNKREKISKQIKLTRKQEKSTYTHC